jgi:hypothetical protein
LGGCAGFLDCSLLCAYVKESGKNKNYLLGIRIRTKYSSNKSISIPSIVVIIIMFSKGSSNKSIISIIFVVCRL